MKKNSKILVVTLSKKGSKGMPKECSINIDSLEDLVVAKYYLEKKKCI